MYKKNMTIEEAQQFRAECLRLRLERCDRRLKTKKDLKTHWFNLACNMYRVCSQNKDPKNYSWWKDSVRYWLERSK